MHNIIGSLIGRVWVTVALLAVTGGLCLSCSPGGVAMQDTGDYPRNISAIVVNNCLGGNCHTGTTASGFDLTSWKAMMQTGDIAEVIPFRPLNSHMFQHMNTDPSINASADPIMPLGRDPLSLNDQRTFYDWIAAGAPSIGGTIYYSTIPEPLVVIHQEQDLLSVVDRSNNRLARIFVDGNDPVQKLPSIGARALASSLDHRKLFIGFIGGLLRSFDGITYSKIAEGNFANEIRSIALLPDSSKGYLITTNASDPHSIIIFDPQHLTVRRTVSDPSIRDAESISVSADGSRAYLVCGASDDIKIIDTKSDSIIGNICCGLDVPQPLPPSYTPRYKPFKIALAADGRTAWVTLELSREAIEIDLTSKVILRRTQVGYLPLGIALSPDDAEVWVVNQNSGTASVIDATSGAVVATIDSLSNSPEGITMAPDGKTVYITCEYLASGGHHHSSGGGPPGGIFVIDRTSRKRGTSIEMPPYCTSILIP